MSSNNLEVKLGKSLDDLIKQQKTKQVQKKNVGKKPVKGGAAGGKQNTKTPAKPNAQQQKQKTPGSNKGVAAMKPTQRGGVAKAGSGKGRTVLVQKQQPSRGDTRAGNYKQQNNNNRGNQGRGGDTRTITVNAKGGKGKPAFKRRQPQTDLLNMSRQPLGDRFEKMWQPQGNVVNTASTYQGGPKRNAHGLIMPF